MKIIESNKNEWIKQLKKLEKKKYRDLENRYLIEGEHLVEEAIMNQSDIEFLLITAESYETYQHLVTKVSDDILVQVTTDIIKHLSSLPSPQQVMAIVKKGVKANKESIKNHLLLLDNVQDPGNVGTMIRTADAAGFKGVVLGEGSADIYNTKVLRSMQGSHFHIQVEEATLENYIIELKNDGYQVYATELNDQAISFKEIPTTEKIAIIMGNEGQGVRKEIIDLCDCPVYIPMFGQAESLNVAVAAGIVMFSL
ncbi:TrmH family RNA methyltransferase [Vagococcus fluvialis]|uniref:TrmH family RNA methyltransferase n=1 Tax=Vagococcus fluvialis TaxID=2738 RepID=UPI003B5ACF37